MVLVKQEERCQVVVCRHGQDLSSGAKFVLKPGDSVRIGRGRGNEAGMEMKSEDSEKRRVVLDYEGVSKHHAEIVLREKLPEEVILGSDVKLPTMLSIRDLTPRNGIGIRKMAEDGSLPTIGSFERLQSATSQVLQDGCCILIPAKSRRYDKQMTVEQRIVTFHVSTVTVDVPVPVPPPIPTPRPVERRIPPAVAPPIPISPARPARAPPRAISPIVSPPRYAPPVAPPVEPVAKPKKKKPKKTVEDERLSFARPVRTEGIATLTGEAWPPVLPREEVEGYDVPSQRARSLLCPCTSSRNRAECVVPSSFCEALAARRVSEHCMGYEVEMV
eukprot:Skav236605  [mRNA]  locus=scaffold3553:5218:7546:- [translate_table: standard]